MKRIFDLFFATIIAILFSPLIIFIAIAIKLTSKGPILFWSDRVGVDNLVFSMPKFRTMHIDTPVVATHLIDNPDRFLTRIGNFLRKTSFDEIPQLFSIIKGDISFVGPRPALYNQDDLIRLRTEHSIHELIPGLTGWAQINGRDHISIPLKVRYDLEYLERRSFRFDMYILWKTFLKAIKREGVSH